MLPGLVSAGLAGGAAATNITLSADFDSPSGTSPVTTATRTLSVPGGTGTLRFDIVSTSGGTDRYSLNGGTFTTFADEATLSVAEADTLAIRHQGAGTDSVFQLYDHTTGAAVGSGFSILCD